MMLHPLMLAWIGGAMVPLVLHLLSRSRYRAVPWGAMMFLTGIDAGSHHAARAKQIILLLFRMAAIGLLAVALARPVIASRYSTVPTAGLTTGGPAAVVIIVDDSASMGYIQNGKSRLDQGREVTLQILSSLKRGDQAALLLAGSRDYQPPAPPSADLQSIAGRMADLQPDIGQADFAFEVNRAADLLEHAAPAEREIYVVCDSQALGWRNVTDAFKKQWTARRSKGSAPRVTVIPVGGVESDNVAVDAIEIPNQNMIRDHSSMVYIRVHNYGSTSRPSIPLSVWTGARPLSDTAIGVPAHSIKSVNVPVRFGESGSRVISAAVTSTGLTTDDRLDAAVDVIDPLQVLMVTDNAEIAASQPTTFSATQPVPSRRNGEVAVIKTIPLADWAKETLSKFDAVILSDVPDFTPEQQTALRQFASTGGGVLFHLGSHVNADNYNKIGRGILPAMLRPIIAKSVRITNLNRQNPIFRFLPNRFDFVANQFFPVGLLAPASHVLARFNSGDPWLIESDIDRGRVLLMTADIDRDMQSHLMQSVIRYLGSSKVVDRNLSPGVPIVTTVDDPVDAHSATVQLASGGPREPAIMLQVADHTEIRYFKTGKPGTYRLRYRVAGKEELINYVVSASRSESDLTTLTEDQWQTLSNRIRFNRVDLSKTTVADAMNIQRGGREIWIDLLGAVLLLMTAEMFLSRRWSN